MLALISALLPVALKIVELWIDMKSGDKDIANKRKDNLKMHLKKIETNDDITQDSINIDRLKQL